MTQTTTSNTARRGSVRVQPSPKRVRIYLGGKLVADSTAALLVWEAPYYPTYYLPVADVRAELEPTDTTTRSPSRGEAVHYTVRVGEAEAVDGALRYPDSPLDGLRDTVRFDWDAMDAWFEEDEEIFVHPRDPHTRVDVLPSSRHVRVLVNGEVVADSHRPWLLFETGLPTRYYLPKVDVRMDLLEPTDTVTHCPYKGDAQYWAVRAGGETVPDIAWSYRHPVPESIRVAGAVSFYNERVDIEVDGLPLDRPQTKFS